MTDRRDDDLADLADELSDTLAELRDELREPPRGPLGVPRPPTPGELLRFADQHAIPTAIAVLEANVRALELLQGALRLADPGRAAADESERVRRRAETVSRTTLDRLDSTLHDLQAAANEGALPENADAREIIEDARTLRAEIADRLTEPTPPEPGDSDPETTPDTPANGGVEIDVEDELDSIRAELEDDEDEDGDDASEDGDETDDPQTGSNR